MEKVTRDVSLVYTESELQDILKIKDQDNNDYATKKSVSQNQLNVSGIMYLISLFLAVFSSGEELNAFQIALIVLICVSISLQFCIFTLVTILANSKTEQLSTRCSCTATGVNNLVTTFSGLLLIITTAITSVSTYARIQGVLPVNNTI
jgi:threonine/homoserine/homoserine lactone efflux protein